MTNYSEDQDIQTSHKTTNVVIIVAACGLVLPHLICSSLAAQ